LEAAGVMKSMNKSLIRLTIIVPSKHETLPPISVGHIPVTAVSSSAAVITSVAASGTCASSAAVATTSAVSVTTAAPVASAAPLQKIAASTIVDHKSERSDESADAVMQEVIRLSLESLDGPEPSAPGEDAAEVAATSSSSSAASSSMSTDSSSANDPASFVSSIIPQLWNDPELRAAFNTVVSELWTAVMHSTQSIAVIFDQFVNRPPLLAHKPRLLAERDQWISLMESARAAGLIFLPLWVH